MSIICGECNKYILLDNKDKSQNEVVICYECYKKSIARLRKDIQRGYEGDV